MTWLSTEGDDVILRLHIQPGARQTEVVGLHGDALKIRLAAPPIDGRANEVLIAFLADRLGLAKSGIGLISGKSSRAKRIRISACDSDHVESRLSLPMW